MSVACTIVLFLLTSKHCFVVAFLFFANVDVYVYVYVHMCMHMDKLVISLSLVCVSILMEQTHMDEFATFPFALVCVSILMEQTHMDEFATFPFATQVFCHHDHQAKSNHRRSEEPSRWLHLQAQLEIHCEHWWRELKRILRNAAATSKQVRLGLFLMLSTRFARNMTTRRSFVRAGKTISHTYIDSSCF